MDNKMQVEQELAMIKSAFLSGVEFGHASIRIEIKDGRLVVLELTKKYDLRPKN